MKRKAYPHLENVECGLKRIPVDLYIEKYGTGHLPKKYERALEKYFGTTDKKEMAKKFYRSKNAPVMCPTGVIELVEQSTGNAIKRLGMDKAKVAARLLKIAKELIGKQTYQEYFEGKLKKYKVDSPSELSDEDKKKFFEEVDAGWNAKEETD